MFFWPAGGPAVLQSKNFNIGLNTQTVQPNFFIPAMLMGTIEFYPFVVISLTLTLPRGHNVSTKQNLSASFSPTLFIWSGWNLMRWWSNPGWTSWCYFCLKRKKKRNKGNNCCCTDCIKKALTLACIQMLTSRFDSNLVDYCTLHFDACPWFQVTGVRESKKLLCQFLTKFQSIWMEFGIPLTLGIMNLILISCPL